MKTAAYPLVFLVFAALTVSPVLGIILGPMYPPPGGVNWSSSGIDPGETDGLDWIYADLDFTAGNIANLYWAPRENFMGISLDNGNNYSGAEILQLSGDPNGGVAVWTGQSYLTYRPYSTANFTTIVVDTRYTVTLSGNADWIVPGPPPAEIIGHNGAVAEITGDFTANLLAEAYFPNGMGWLPIHVGFDYLETLGTTGSSFGAGFWYEPLLVLDISQPNGGEILMAGHTYTVLWQTVVGIPDVTLEYSTDNGGSYATIETVGNTGEYEWTVPDVNSVECLVRVSDSTDVDVNDTSDDVFTIFICELISPADMNDDCRVDLPDFALFVLDWLRNGNPFDPGYTEGLIEE